MEVHENLPSFVVWVPPTRQKHLKMYKQCWNKKEATFFQAFENLPSFMVWGVLDPTSITQVKMSQLSLQWNNLTTNQYETQRENKQAYSYQQLSKRS